MKKIYTILLVLSLSFCYTGCVYKKNYHATFTKSTEFNFVDNGKKYAQIIHEGDILTFSTFLEEDGIGYAIFSYEDTTEIKLSLGRRISENIYEYATIEVD